MPVYGYYWWLNHIAAYDMYSALGAAGQILHVIPELELVMVTTHSFAGNPRDYAEEAESYQFLWNDLIPAIDGALIDTAPDKSARGSPAGKAAYCPLAAS